MHNGKSWADLEFALAGEYNVMNATAAAALASDCGIRRKQIVSCAQDLQEREAPSGSGAQVNGITIIDDFAHHPTAIAGTLKALHERYPEPGYGPFWSRVLTRCAGMFSRMNWPAALRLPMRLSWPTCLNRNQSPNTSAWMWRRW